MVRGRRNVQRFIVQQTFVVRYVILFIAITHGATHLMGFVNGAGLAKTQGFSGETLFPLSKTAQLFLSCAWLLAAVLFFTTIVLFLLHKGWVSMAFAALLLSQMLIVLYWPGAQWGTLLNVLLTVITVVSFAEQNFSNNVQADVRRLLSRPNFHNELVTGEMLNNLPSPVQKWLRHSGSVGKEKIRCMRLKQTGWMRTKPEQKTWTKALAEQYFRVDEPAFIWRVKMNMTPLIPVSGCDRFVDGKGTMQIKLWSLINAVNQSGPKIDEGTLQRFLAEICWMPSAALSPFIKWKAVGANDALATLTYKGCSGEVLFHFTKDGDIGSCTADRYKGGGANDVKERWEVTAKKYGIQNGIRLPVQLEATWKLKGGDFTWYKIEVTNVEYNEPGFYKESFF